MIKGRSCKNPPYKYMTDKKWDSLGETITIKEALDMWWNSVRVRTPKGIENHIFTMYKCCDGEYVLDDMADILEISEEDILKCTITLDDEYDDDGDEYPIVYATLSL